MEMIEPVRRLTGPELPLGMCSPPDSDLSAARSQPRYMPNERTQALLTDIGTEELAAIRAATYTRAKGDPMAALRKDIATEEKARANYHWHTRKILFQVHMGKRASAR